MRWGTKEWFARQAECDKDCPESYFSHGVNGYQLYRHQWILKELRRTIPKGAVRSVVDLGCGGGELLDAIRRAFGDPTAIGLDFVERIIEIAGERFPDCEFYVASLPKVPVERSSADLVIAAEVLYYLANSDQEKALRKIHEILRPNGYVVVTSAIGKGYLTAEELQALLGAAGFTMVKVTYFHARLYKWAAVAPQRIALLDDYHDSGIEPASDRSKAVFRVASGALRVPGVRYVLSITARWSRGFLRSKYWPERMEKVGRKCGSFARNGVIVIAQKVDG